MPWDFAKNLSFNTVGTLSGLAVYSSFGLMIIISALFLGIPGNGKSKIFFSRLGFIDYFELLILNYPAIWFTLALAALFLAGFKFINSSKLNLFLTSIIVFFFLSGWSAGFFRIGFFAGGSKAEFFNHFKNSEGFVKLEAFFSRQRPGDFWLRL